MIQSKYFCPVHGESISTTDPNFAKDKLYVKRAVAFMESHKNCTATIRKQLEEHYANNNK
jgi:hypothetical protein